MPPTTATTTTTTFRHWIFGYGSLICPSSRAVTAPSLEGRRATPVVVRHLERLWSFPVSECGMTFMGIRPQHNARAVGVLVPVSDDELVQFDAREFGYDRVPLEHRHVERIAFLGDDHYGTEATAAATAAAQKKDLLCYFDQLKITQKTGNSQEGGLPNVWVYIQQTPSPVRRDAPIAQTYLDVILRGCLTISKQFAHQFIATTRGWHVEDFHGNQVEEEESHNGDHSTTTNVMEDAATTTTTIAATATAPVETFWVDDRHDPIYVRADSTYSQQYGHELDVLLGALRPSELAHRYQRVQ